MSINQTNSELPLSWDEAKGYLDRLDPDLLESVLSVDYSNPDEFYARLFKVLCRQLAREIDKLRACGKSMRKSAPSGWNCSRKQGIKKYDLTFPHRIINGNENNLAMLPCYYVPTRKEEKECA